MFKPTFLYIKKHNETGLKYFGKTTSKNPEKYPGSGLHWQRHIEKHGNDVTTVWFKLFTNKDECVKYAKEFSEQNNIVESVEWANMKPEDGVNGGNHTEEIRKRIGQSGLGRKYSSERNDKIQRARAEIKDQIYKKVSRANKGKKRTQEQCDRISKAKKDAMSDANRHNLSKSKLGSKNPAWKGLVVTPDGTFASLGVAAEFYALTPVAISRRCNNPKFIGWHIRKSS